MKELDKPFKDYVVDKYGQCMWNTIIDQVYTHADNEFAVEWISNQESNNLNSMAISAYKRLYDIDATIKDASVITGTSTWNNIYITMSNEIFNAIYSKVDFSNKGYRFEGFWYYIMDSIFTGSKTLRDIDFSIAEKRKKNKYKKGSFRFA